MPTPIQRACEYAKSKAQAKSSGYCAKFVRLSIDFGFTEEIKKGEKKPVENITAAKDYGPAYEAFGFKKVFNYSRNLNSSEDYQPQLGDIAIIEYEPYGHICINTDGTKKGWISDFIQRDMYGGKVRDKDPQFTIYRYATNAEVREEKIFILPN